MSTNAQRICIQVLSLPRESRAGIAERILTSLEEQAESKAEGASRALIRRRRAEIHSGKAKVRPAEKVMREAYRLLRTKRC
jgi:putative addiction module component (TIGR02574 family)